MMKKVGIIGHFGFGKNLLNGQTIKTKMIAEQLEVKYGNDNVLKLDLAGGVKRIPYLLAAVPAMLRRCENAVILPVENGLKFLTPVLSVWNVLFRKRLHYVVIGGWLPQFISNQKWLCNGLKRFHGIYVETNAMKTDLEKLNFCNVIVMPNFKKLNVLNANQLDYTEKKPLRFCTFSRVMKEKGIEDAVDAIKSVNTELGYTAATLDIFGQIWSEYKDSFEYLQSSFPNYIRYCGVVDPDGSVDVLKDYFVLLFPTYYYGEGYAGTLIDAFAAGLPVIATDWKYNSEIVTEDTGYLYQTGDQTALINLIKITIENPLEILTKKKNCLEAAKNNSIDRAMQILFKEVESE